ncbi:MAG: sugar phosphate isomerase/epimerase [Verrucomicrobia bacterium]|nr:MAG: sugar phosphate isomerase/epimerase [Verrucomicrobiota bacterium]
MMLHTFSTLGCPELDLDGAIQLAARHGFFTLELRVLSGTTELPAWFQKHYGSPTGLAAHLKRRRVKVCALATSFRLVGNDEPDREQLMQFVPWADETGVQWLRVFDGGKCGDATDVAEALATLHWWREQRIQNNWAVELLVETRDGFVTSASLRALISRCPHLRLLWDAHHTWKKGGEAPSTTWPVIRNHVVHIHVKDSVHRPSPNGLNPYTYVLPGDGDFPMQGLMSVLETDSYHGVISLEWERMWHPDLPELDKALYRAKQHHWW